jgi:hypothetical protein
MTTRSPLRRCLLAVGVLALSTVSGVVMHLHGAEHTSRNPFLSENETGLIYGRTWPDRESRMWQMGSCWEQHRVLPEGVRGEPSRGLHAGHRLFADVRPSENESDPAANKRYRLHVICDDGATIGLPHDSNIEPMPGSVRWPLHAEDRMLAWIGRRWDSTGAVAQAGIYVAEVEYDNDGSIAGIKQVSQSPLVSLPVVTFGDLDPWYRSPVPDADSHDWSPDGKAIVVVSTGGRLQSIEVASGAKKLLTECPASHPVWSPDGRRIAFTVRRPLGGVAIVDSTGGEPEVVFGPMQGTPFAVTSPCWSPSGQCIMVGYIGPQYMPPERPIDVDLVVIDLAEGRYVNLTPYSPGAIMPTASR